MGITVGYHRMITHRSFESHPWIKICLLVMGDGPCKTPPCSGAPTISRHHAHTDEEADPYNASKGFWHSHVGWLFINTPYREDRFAAKLRTDPMILWQHRYYWAIVASGLLLPFAAAGYLNGGFMSGASGVFTRRRVAHGPGAEFHLTINSLCHMVGTQPHGTQDSSRDGWLLISFISFGEGYHNYHHTYSHDYRNGSKWYNFDPSKWLIYTLSLVGLTYNLHRERT